MPKRILVTGHQGFVGRNLLKSLPSDVEIVGIDLKSGKDCRDFFRADNSYFDEVFHLAAIVGGRMTIENQPLTVATDLAIDSDMFQWALRTRPGKVVYYSSSAAYPVSVQNEFGRLSKESDINLNDVRSPDFTYGWCKLTGEYLAEFARKEGLNVYVFRPFSGYGSDQDLSYPFPKYIERASLRKNPFQIWGDGMQVRDFVHIDDVIGCTLAVMEQDDNVTVNICSGIATNFRQLADLCCREEGYSPEFEFIGDAPVGVTYRCGDPTLMNKYYQLKISLEEGVKKALCS